MVAAQNMVQTLLGTDNSTRPKRVFINKQHPVCLATFIQMTSLQKSIECSDVMCPIRRIGGKSDGRMVKNT